MNKNFQRNKAFAEEALRKIRENPSNFNEWRKRTPSYHLDLEGYDLRNLNLANINLSKAKLKGVNFSYSNLTEAKLAGANLNGAILKNANLQNADLRQARMERAILNETNIEGSNLYATIRDEWKVSGIICTYCWITHDRAQSPENPDKFQRGEFEMTYGGHRISVNFRDGFQPIDLLALPYHALKLIDEFPNHKLILVGVDTIGETKLVFRIDEKLNDISQQEINDAFQHNVPEIRENILHFYNEIIKSLLESNKILSSTVNDSFELVKNIVNKPNSIYILAQNEKVLLAEGQNNIIFNDNGIRIGDGNKLNKSSIFNRGKSNGDKNR